MDIQQYLQEALAIRRAEAMETSPQLTLGKLIARLEAIEDKSKPVIFNETYCPIGLDSWRGSYAELSIDYGTGQEPTLSTTFFLALLKGAIGASFEGYKGGEFVMSNETPVWVANYGESGGFNHEGDIWSQAVVGVSEDERHVIIETKNIEY